MKLNKYSFLLFLLIFTWQCKAQDKQLEQALKKCVNQQINKNSPYSQNTDFYKVALKLEQLFIKGGYLKNENKENYRSFLLEILDEKKDFKKLYCQSLEITNKYKFDFELFTYINPIFSQCPYEIASKYKNDKGKLIYNQGSILSQLMSEGFKNKSILKKLFLSIDNQNFKKIVYRAPVILVVIINLDNQYNLDLKKAEENKKGKKFLKEN